VSKRRGFGVRAPAPRPDTIEEPADCEVFNAKWM
jgi:hypothetical protein